VSFVIWKTKSKNLVRESALSGKKKGELSFIPIKTRYKFITLDILELSFNIQSILIPIFE